MCMANYLTKEEIKQWRSSLEKMTLEEYAAKLGKVINTEKETNDMIDKVMSTNSVDTMTIEEYHPKAETIKTITQKTILREKELIEKYNKHVKFEPTTVKKSVKKEVKPKIDNKKFIEKIEDEKVDTTIEYAFKKSLTQREQGVFDYFKTHKGEIVYAKDLAELLTLPRDYIYKYIKTLRNKMEVECIFNAENGGFILK